jgi:hypothetical protein
MRSEIYRIRDPIEDMASERLRVPRAGEVAPDFTLPDVEGGVVKLSECPKPVAAVFLRHLS